MYGEWWMWILSFAWWQIIATTSISSGYHRYFSHRSFIAPKWYEIYCQILALFANSGPVLTWASAHRMHHAYSDASLDPHSPKFKGFWKVYTNQWGYSITIKRKFLKNLIDNKTVLFFYRYYFKLQFVIFTIFLIINPMLFIFAVALPIVFAFHGYGMINAVTHRKGSASNSIIANLLTAGEGYHKFHHEDSKNWQIGKKWYHFDIGSWFIKGIKK
jgi:stearoyl-CoA desaturase (delta-9 desaturase)